MIWLLLIDLMFCPFPLAHKFTSKFTKLFVTQTCQAHSFLRDFALAAISAGNT